MKKGNPLEQDSDYYKINENDNDLSLKKIYKFQL